jgi:hypothetical protein
LQAKPPSLALLLQIKLWVAGESPAAASTVHVAVDRSEKSRMFSAPDRLGSDPFHQLATPARSLFER